MFTEMGARRRRLRASLGDRGQALTEFLVLGGLAVGSLGLFVRPWMPAAAPWGFWLPLVFIVGFLLIEARRQAAIKVASVTHAQAAEAAQAVARGEHTDMPMVVDENGRTIVERVTAGYDWIALGWSFGCALLGAAAFVIAWSAAPPAPPEDWSPPNSAVSVDISP